MTSPLYQVFERFPHPEHVSDPGTMFEEPLHRMLVIAAMARCYVNCAQNHRHVYVRLSSAYAQQRLHYTYENTRFQAFQQRLFQAKDLGWLKE
jgi:hypothetical protein